MTVRLQIAFLLYLMIQAVLFGVGILGVLLTPLASQAQTLIPWVIGVSAALSAPIAWYMAPTLRLRHQRRLARRAAQTARTVGASA